MGSVVYVKITQLVRYTHGNVVYYTLYMEFLKPVAEQNKQAGFCRIIFNQYYPAIRSLIPAYPLLPAEQRAHAHSDDVPYRCVSITLH